MYLRDDAADAINALEDKYGTIRINRATVSEAVQQTLIDRWNKGGAANRPPFLFQPKSPAKKSEHVQAIAVDVYNYTSDRAKLEEFGFRWYGPTDPVHYTFVGWNRPATNTPTPAPEEKDEDMANKALGHYVGKGAEVPAEQRTVLIYWPDSGLWTMFSGADQAYINARATQACEGNFTTISVDEYTRYLRPNLKALSGVEPPAVR